MNRSVRRADPDPQPAERLGAQLADDRAQPVVAARSAALAKPQLAEGQGEVVDDDQHLGERRPLPRQHLAHGEPGVVHERLRLHEQQVEAAKSPADDRPTHRGSAHGRPSRPDPRVGRGPSSRCCGGSAGTARRGSPARRRSCRSDPPSATRPDTAGHAERPQNDVPGLASMVVRLGLRQPRSSAPARAWRPPPRARRGPSRRGAACRGSRGAAARRPATTDVAGLPAATLLGLLDRALDGDRRCRRCASASGPRAATAARSTRRAGMTPRIRASGTTGRRSALDGPCARAFRSASSRVVGEHDRDRGRALARRRRRSAVRDGSRERRSPASEPATPARSDHDSTRQGGR